MAKSHRTILAIAILSAALLSCKWASTLLPGGNSPTPLAPATAGLVPQCAYVPGQSSPPQLAAEPTATPAPTATPPAFSAAQVDDATRAQQLEIYNQILDRVNNNYIYKDYNGKDWKAISQKYGDLVKKGLKQADFYEAMSWMIAELSPDGNTYYSSPSREKTNQHSDWVGLGAYKPYNYTEKGQPIIVLSYILAGSPAEQAGLKPHDTILQIDGGPVLDAEGNSRSLGPEGSQVILTVRTPGQASRQVRAVRGRVRYTANIEACLIASSNVGYIRLLGTDDAQADRMTQALKNLGRLKGLILDIRMFSGEQINIDQKLLGLFAGGELGQWVTRQSSQPFRADPMQDILGSQNVPLVILQDTETDVSPLFAGVLQLSGRARLVGQPAGGVVVKGIDYPFSDGSALHLQTGEFQPKGKPLGFWDKTGVIPDVEVNGRFDQFTDANDPYIAKALELLIGN